MAPQPHTGLLATEVPLRPTLHLRQPEPLTERPALRDAVRHGDDAGDLARQGPARGALRTASSASPSRSDPGDSYRLRPKRRSGLLQKAAVPEPIGEVT
jgi:hypothetical protein